MLVRPSPAHELTDRTDRSLSFHKRNELTRVCGCHGGKHLPAWEQKVDRNPSMDRRECTHDRSWDGRKKGSGKE